ncbi:transglutaminaseTgpA domain-containing protein [Ramlibacter sp. MMS24-I3-19]|uniref:transglutaminase family protein n=1 Tax=Ramlibacter sp. MMS24-I3-19 TaxID=3416606 RepID=UPI003CFE60ED
MLTTAAGTGLTARSPLARLRALPREARDTLFLLVVIGWLVLPQVSRLPLWCTALTAIVLAWRGRLAVRGSPLPRTRWLLVLLVATLAATFATHRTLLGRDAGVTLIVVLLALKTLELRARRDAFVVFFLGFFTMLTNFFFSQSLATAGAMLVGLLGLLTALVNAHMPVGRPPLAHAARTAGWMALLGAPIMAVLFVLFPRLAPLWGLPGDGMTGRSGLSATMQVGTVAQLALEEGIAMRVRFDGPPPPGPLMYFRGPVLSSFDGREWRPLVSRPGADAAALLPPVRLQAFGPEVRYTVTLEANNRPWLPVLDAAIQPPAAPGLEAVPGGELQWSSRRPVTDLLRYTAVSQVDYRAGAQGSAAGVLPQYRDLPAGFNPRTLQLATEMIRSAPGGAADKPALVEAALQRLRTGGYVYTLDPGVYGEHTADEFWFDRKEGFCEHIASAFVVLMRAMDIPARIVTGYQGGELNPVDGYWVVRHSDAHAWAEVWLAGRGWVRVDPTGAVAPSRMGTLQRLRAPQGAFASAFATMSPGLLVNFRQGWDAVNNRWNQWILNYTQSRQLDLLRNVGFRSPDWADLALVLIGLLVAVTLCGIAWAKWDRQRQDPWLRLLARVRARLVQAGVPLAATSGPRQMAQAVTDRFGASAQPLADWLLRLEAQRYARHAPAPLPALQRELQRLSWPSAAQ